MLFADGNKTSSLYVKVEVLSVTRGIQKAIHNFITKMFSMHRQGWTVQIRRAGRAMAFGNFAVCCAIALYFPNLRRMFLFEKIVLRFKNSLLSFDSYRQGPQGKQCFNSNNCKNKSSFTFFPPKKYPISSPTPEVADDLRVIKLARSNSNRELKHRHSRATNGTQNVEGYFHWYIL